MADDSNGGFGFAPRPAPPGAAPPRPTMIGNGQNANRARQMGSQWGGQGAYQQHFGRANEARGQQMGALALTRDAAMGKAPSQAEILGHSMVNDSLNAQLAGAASARGGPAAQAAAMRQAQMGAAAFQQQGANNIAAMRAGEMANARDAYAAQAGNLRSGDLSQVGMRTQNEQFQRGLNAQQRLGYEQMANGLDVQQAQLNQQGNQFDQTLAQRQSEYDRDLSDKHWAEQAQLNQHATDRSTNLWATIGGGILSGAGGALGGILSKSDPRSKTNVRNLSMGGGTDPWMPPERSDIDQIKWGEGPWVASPPRNADVDFIKYGPNADPGALQDRYDQAPHDAPQWLQDAMRPPPAPPGAPPPERGVAGAPRGYAASRRGQMGSMFDPPAEDGGPGDAGRAPGSSDWDRYGASAKDEGDPDWTKGGSTKSAEDGEDEGSIGAYAKGLGQLGGGLSSLGSSDLGDLYRGSRGLHVSDPASKLGLAPMNAVDPDSGTVQLHDGGISGADLRAAGTGLAGPQAVPGMVGGGGITGGSVNTAGRGSDGSVNLVSDPAAKRAFYQMGRMDARSSAESGQPVYSVESPLRATEELVLTKNGRPEIRPRATPEDFTYSHEQRRMDPESFESSRRMGAELGYGDDAVRPNVPWADHPNAPQLDMPARRPAGEPALTNDASSLPYEANHPGSAPPARMMDSIGSGKSWQYKPGVPGEDPSKRHFGTTTADLKRTPMGSSMVVPGSPLTGGYEAINTKEAVGPMLASLGNLNERLRMLEKGRK